jgi:hypothetical protein
LSKAWKAPSAKTTLEPLQASSDVKLYGTRRIPRDFCLAHTADAVHVRHIVCTSVSTAWFFASNAAKGEGMRKDDLMKADLFSEILLLGSGVAIAVALVMVVVAALTSAAALQ